MTKGSYPFQRVLLVLLLIAVVLPVFAAITITENSPTRLSFRWDLDSFDTVSVRESGSFVTYLSFDGENISLGEAGEPVLPGQSIYVGVPQTGDPRITFTPLSTETIRMAHPLRLRPLDSLRSAPRQPDLRFSDTWLSNPRHVRFRSLSAAQLVIRPVIAQGSAVRLLRSAKCTIEFPPASRTAPPRSSDYQRMLSRLFLNYDVASGWGRPRPLRKSVETSPFLPGQRRFSFVIGDGHAGMNEVTTRENGLLKITGAQVLRLFGASPGAVALDDVMLYASFKGRLPMAIPQEGAIPDGVVELPLLRVDRGTPDLLDGEDYFIAWVTGLNDWHYDSVRNEFDLVIDEYDDDRTYWLTVRSGSYGKPMETFSQPAPGLTVLDRFTNRAVFREPRLRPSNPDKQCRPQPRDVVGFVWQTLSPLNPSFEYGLDLPLLDETEGGTLTLKTFSSSTGIVSARLAGRRLCADCRGGTAYEIPAWGDRRLSLTYDNTGKCDFWELERIVAEYQSPISADVLPMTVFSSEIPGVISYRLSGIGGKRVTIVRVPENERAIALIDTVTGVDSRTWSDTGGRGVRYFVCDDAGFLSMPDEAFSPDTTPDLRGTANETDYLIISHPAFLNQAQRLARFKASIGFSSPMAVNVEHVYNCFSGGNVDPAAIRNFIAYVRRYWRNGEGLDYVLLMGAGSLDLKGVKSASQSLIPTAEPGNECVEDFFVQTDPQDASALQVALGRLPCRSATDAAAMVDKIIAVQDPQQADWGTWRNTMLCIADDDMQGADFDPIRGSMAHHVSSEKTAAVVEANRPAIDMRKIYLFDYEWDVVYEKPGASRAIINAINGGVGHVNWYGHGSEDVLADEHVLSVDLVSHLYNEGLYPLFTSFSCAVSKFDKPENVSLGEAFLLQPKGGMIAVFAATREVSALSNEALGLALYARLFDSTANPSIGMAILDAKANVYDNSARTYVLLGDPSVRQVNPGRRVRLQVTDTAGLPRDTLMALQRIRISGSVVDASGAVDASFGSSAPASVQLSIFNASTVAIRKDGGKDTSVRYLNPGTPVFSGRVPVRNGVFEQKAVLPSSLTFDRAGPRITAYAWEGAVAGLGSRQLIFHGTQPQPAEGRDTIGPRISLRPVYDIESMRPVPVSSSAALTSSLPLKFEIELVDESGINVIGTGPGEGLTMEIPGSLSRRNINQTFQFQAGDYRQGTALVTVGESSLKKGSHKLLITAQDLLGNVTTQSIELTITDEEDLSLNQVFNSPNPMRMGESTRFYFFPSTQTPAMRAEVMIKIYSLSGKLLKVIRNAGNGEAWDGRDQTGYKLPPNIYLYQVIADYPLRRKQTRSKVQKLVIHPPAR